MAADVMVIVERQFDDPRPVVFRAWTAPDELAQWRGSPGWCVERASLMREPKLGGRHTHVKARDSDASTRVGTDGVYTEYFDPDVFVSRERITGDPGIDPSRPLEGDASAALVQTAQDRGADLLVLGARFDRTLAERLLGTVASEVVKRAPCDILIVRPAEPGELPVPEDAPT